MYKDFGINLEESNGRSEWELPLSATYVIETDGKVAYSLLDVDYKKRAETGEIIKILESLKSTATQKKIDNRPSIN